MLILEGAQAGLSWITILRKRENYRKAFDKFNPKKICKYSEKDMKKLMNDAGIIRNRQKISAAINNAQRFLEIKKEFGSFDKYMWAFVNNKPIKNKFSSLKQLPAKTENEHYELEYGRAAVEIHVDAIEKGSKVLLVDDLIATAGTLLASINLIKKLGGELVECAVIIELPDLHGRRKVEAKGCKLFSLVQFEGD